MRQYAESRAELGDHLLLYQIHSATVETGVLGDQGVLSELARLKEQAHRSIGERPTATDVIRQSIDVRVDGEPLFQTVQATWNVLERSAGSALAEAHQAGYGVIVKEALANGRLTNRGELASGVLGRIAAAHGVQVDAVAVAAALANPWVHVVLLGPVTSDQLRSNLAGLSIRLSTAELHALATLSEPSERYWSLRKSSPWS